jgi:hypothetical protein
VIIETVGAEGSSTCSLQLDAYPDLSESAMEISMVDVSAETYVVPSGQGGKIYRNPLCDRHVAC